MEDDNSSAKYDIASGMLSIALTKSTRGEHFEDLDLTNRLLARTGETFDAATGKVNPPPKIVLADVTPSYANGEFEEAIDFDFQIPQTIPQEQIFGGDKYGFNNQYSGVFTYSQSGEAITCPEPEGKTAFERWMDMRKQEDEKFDREWYLADKFDPPDELDEILAYAPPLDNNPFTTEEQAQLRNLGNRDCTPLHVHVLTKS